jgi:riboflavin synthase
VFTGIVQGLGRIVRVHPHEIDCGAFDLTGVAVGDSVCVQGVCLTVTSRSARGFAADVSQETLGVTTGLDQPGEVNLEKALRAGDPLGGHLVSGHVDGIGELMRRDTSVFTFRAPPALGRLIARKGSICIDGVSLTVNSVERDLFSVNLIPHTLQATTLSRLAPSSKVNLEADMIARYVDRLMEARR